MQELKQHTIWEPSTGISDLDESTISFSSSELPGIRAVWSDQRRRLKGTKQLLDFTERLSREWAIETGLIENLYSIERGVTQTLIEHGFQADLLRHGSTNKPKEFVIQLLRDQKDALEGIFDFVSSKRNLSVSYIKELHAALLRSQMETDAVTPDGHDIRVPLIKGAWKNRENFPVRDGTRYSYCPPEQVASEMDRLIALHEAHVERAVPTEVQAAWLHHRFAQIHPFQDGNGRVARAIASLVLIKDDLFPLVVTESDNPNYLGALESADSGNLRPLIILFAKLQRIQFAKATAISESILSEDASVQQLMAGLALAAEKVAEQKQKTLRQVFDRSREIETETADRLRAICPGIIESLRKIDPNAQGFVSLSTADTDHYFRYQIFQNAKRYLRYFADTADFRAWVALNLIWDRRAKLVFAFHGMGRPFSGTLICAPFLELRDADDDNQVGSTIIPVSDEGFPFFYNETKKQVSERFRPWLEDVIKVALRELRDNL